MLGNRQIPGVFRIYYAAGKSADTLDDSVELARNQSKKLVAGQQFGKE